MKNLPDGQSALQYTRNQLDRLGIGADLKQIPWGSKKLKLPPSKLAAPGLCIAQTEDAVSEIIGAGLAPALDQGNRKGCTYK